MKWRGATAINTRSMAIKRMPAESTYPIWRLIRRPTTPAIGTMLPTTALPVARTSAKPTAGMSARTLKFHANDGANEGPAQQVVHHSVLIALNKAGWQRFAKDR